MKKFFTFFALLLLTLVSATAAQGQGVTYSQGDLLTADELLAGCDQNGSMKVYLRVYTTTADLYLNSACSAVDQRFDETDPDYIFTVTPFKVGSEVVGVELQTNSGNYVGRSSSNTLVLTSVYDDCEVFTPIQVTNNEENVNPNMDATKAMRFHVMGENLRINTNQIPGSSGTKTIFYNGGTGCWTCFFVYAVNETPAAPTTTTVKYTVVDGEGNELDTFLQSDVEVGTVITEVPAELQKDFVTLTIAESLTVTDNADDNVVFVEASWDNLPFETSTAEAPVYYYLSIGGKYYSATAANAVAVGGTSEDINVVPFTLDEIVALPAEERAAYHWALIGNPYTGFKVMNANGLFMSHSLDDVILQEETAAAAYGLAELGEGFSLFHSEMTLCDVDNLLTQREAAMTTEENAMFTATKVEEPAEEEPGVEGTFRPVSRDAELVEGREYMIYNSAVASGNDCWGFVHQVDGSLFITAESAPATYVSGGEEKMHFYTADKNYLFKLKKNEDGSYTFTNVGSGEALGTTFTLTPWDEASAIRGGGAALRNDDGTITPNGDFPGQNVWVITEKSPADASKPNWNGDFWRQGGGQKEADEKALLLFAKGHPYAFYTVEEFEVPAPELVLLTYVVQDAEGNELARLEQGDVEEGTVITDIPEELKRPFSTYTHPEGGLTVSAEGENVYAVTATFDYPFPVNPEEGTYNYILTKDNTAAVYCYGYMRLDDSCLAEGAEGDLTNLRNWENNSSEAALEAILAKYNAGDGGALYDYGYSLSLYGDILWQIFGNPYDGFAFYSPTDDGYLVVEDGFVNSNYDAAEEERFSRAARFQIVENGDGTYSLVTEDGQYVCEDEVYTLSYSVTTDASRAARFTFMQRDNDQVAELYAEYQQLQAELELLVTGVEGVAARYAGEVSAYDLQGRRLQAAGRGLNIVNGRKVLVK